MLFIRIFLFSFTVTCNAATTVGSFSDWYWLNNKTAVDYNITSITLGPEDSKGNGNMNDKGSHCPSTWKGCNIQIYTNIGNVGAQACTRPLTPERSVVIFNDSEWHSFDEINKAIMDKVPLKGTINYERSACKKPTLWIYFSNGYFTELASTDNGGLPPIDPLPPVNVFCRVDGLSNNEINFGVINQESKTASINAYLICDGDYASQTTARLIFTDANRSGGNTIVLTNPQNKQQIKVELSVDSPGASNKKDVIVKVGYKGSVELFASIDESELKRETSGDFTGSAVIIFNVF
ncbi:hypothetical protein [Serratia surfactantfaciens]|uniref:Fimbrial protein n=1 Tax=Serratia surfactantfaciens TaxID=2741499 RepID=A0ABS0M6S0_9GAMM|nr:hypothetical protein [Serratia surfactantfaciens]MBH1922368.1 hypothetical protein [Serratia surfactantfaciens]